MSSRTPPLLLLLVLAQPSYAVVYTLGPDPGLTGGYGFSGTVTTDGTTGSFSDASEITSWDITLMTPGGVDGVTSQTLTEATSTLFFFFQGTGQLVITATEISIVNSDIDNTTNLAFSNGSEGLTFEGPKSTTLTGFVSMDDVTESPAFSSDVIGDAVSAPVAFVIPEPHALCLCMIGVAVLCGATANSRRLSRRKDASLWRGC